MVDTKRILPIGLATIAAAVVANVIVRFILLALIDIDPGFLPFGLPAIIVATAIGVGGAVGVFALINRLSENPIRTFTIVAAVVFVVSIIPNIISAMNPSAVPFPFPGATTAAFLGLIVFHVVAAAISVWMLTTFTRAS